MTDVLGKPGPTMEPPLAGIRVLELGFGAAGPMAGRHLAAHGAEVIRVESRTRPDIIRMFTPAWLPPDAPMPVKFDTSPMWTEFNTGKLSLGLDVGHPAGRQVFLRLIERSDVLLTNMSAGVMPSLSLAYEDVASVRKNLIYCSVPSFGNTPSRYAGYRTFGPNQSPLCGLDSLTGWPDRPPAGIGGFAYPDFLSAAQAAFAITAAVLHRDMTGEGQYIDMSQFEATVAAIGPTLLDCAANGHVQEPTGNRTPGYAPQGVYPAEGRDRWVAISCSTERHWQALCAYAGEAAFVDDPRFGTAADRQANADDLDAALAAWTRSQTAQSLAYNLQRLGVPCGMVQDSGDLLADPQLQSREFFRVDPHARLGADVSTNYPAQLSETPPDFRRGAPCFGEHNRYVLQEVLGLSDEECSALERDGVVQGMADPEVTFRRPYARWARHFLRHDGWDQ